MAYVSNKLKQTREDQDEQIKRDALALASLILDIYRDMKRKEKSNDV